MDTDEVYTLMLNTYASNSNANNNPVKRIDAGNNITNVTWNIDWNDVFKGRQNIYKHCRVRFHLAQGSGTYTFNAGLCYLASNLPSTYNNSNTTRCSTFLGLLYPQTNPNSNGGASQIYDVSTLNDVGVDISIEQLYGKQYLNLQWLTDDASTPLQTFIQTDWEILLHFTLYN
jgi:hypothetical protein